MALSPPGSRRLCVLVVTLSLSCGSDSNSPTGPSGGIAPTDSVSIETQKTVTSLEVSASETTLTVGATTTLYATATYSDGTSAVIDPLWSSSDPAVATVSSSGTVTAVAPGTVTVIATNEGVRYGAIIVAEPAECGTGSPQHCFRIHQVGGE